MKPPPFDYIAPATLDEAVAALADGGEDAKILAGGQSLIPLLSLRLAQPSLLVDVNGVTELAGVTTADGNLTIGSMARHRAVERSKEIESSVPMLALAMPLIGHAAIRSRGTIGGSLAHADPAAELPAVALALDATFTARSRDRGERTITASDFFDGFFTTTLEPDEILCSVTFPVAAPGSGHAIEEVARRHGDFAMVGVVAALTLADGTITDARLGLINVAEKPVRASNAERALVGLKPGADVFADAAAAATSELEPSGDLHASPEYRRKVAGVCIRRALTSAAARAQAAS